MTAREHLSRHDREIAEICAIQKRTQESVDRLAARTEELASAHAKEAAETWMLMGKLAKGSEAAHKETRELRDAICELTADQKRTEAALRSFIQSLRGANGRRKRSVS